MDKEAILKEKIRVTPDSVFDLRELTQLYLNQNRFEEAKKLLDHTIEACKIQKVPYTLELGNLGTLSTAENDFDSAERFYLEAYESNQSFFPAISNLFNLYVMRNEVPKLQEFIRNMKVHKDIGLVLLGNIFKQNNMLVEAYSVYVEAIEINAENYSAYNNLGLLCFDLKKYSDAEAFFKKGILLEPLNDRGYINLALSYLNLNQLKEAQYYMLLYKTLKPKDLASDFYYCKIKILLKELADVKYLCKKIFSENDLSDPNIKELWELYNAAL
ncbi:MAG: tetratricopeptide repeat protein [Gammaproteobacteria bacterium]